MFDYNREFTRDTLIAEYRRMYEFEIQRKDNFGSVKSLAIAIVTLVLGTMTVMASSLPRTSSLGRSLLCVMITVTYLCLGVSILHLFRAISSRRYQYVANIAKIDETIKAMHHRKLSAEDMAAEFDRFLVNRYCEAASNNRSVNNMKSSMFVTTVSWLCLSVVFLFISIGFSVMCSLTVSEPISKIEIVNRSTQVDLNRSASDTPNSRGESTMSNDHKRPQEEEPIKWPDNDKINENEAEPSGEKRKDDE